MKIFLITSDPEGLLPPEMLPLPIPGVPKIKPSEELSKALDWADEILKDPTKGKGRKMYRLLTKDRKGPILEAFWGELSVSSEFYLRYSREVDNPEHYPRGIKVLQDKYRKQLEFVVACGRSGDLAPLFVADYLQALVRCRWLSAATRLGHGPEKNQIRFRKSDVLETMKETGGWVCTLNYDHIKAQLLRECIDHE